MARPRKEIDIDGFKKLCGLQCTLAEIADFFDCSEDTVERWCRRELEMGFADAFKRYSAAGKASLRRNQFELSKKSATMAIWLGKQYLGQKDDVSDQNTEVLGRLDEVLRSMMGSMNAVQSEAD